MKGETTMQTPMKNAYDKAGPRIVEALKKRHFEAYYCSTSAEAAQKVMALIPEDHVVSWGGTVAMDELGILARVRAGERKVIDRDTAQSPEERSELMRRSLLCDTFLMGSNAISEDGQLVNIDGNGNRVAALCYGPKSVIVVVGMNKVAADLETAVQRARHVAAPVNAQRFPAKKTPCLVNGLCGNCTSPDCICNQVVITRNCSPAGRIKVVVVGEHLGF